MKHVSILVPNEAVLASIDDPRYMFTAVNEFLEAEGKPPLFKPNCLPLITEINTTRKLQLYKVIRA